MRRKIIYIIVGIIIALLYSADVYELIRNLHVQYTLKREKERLIKENKYLSSEIEKVKDDNSPHLDYWIRKNLYYCKEDEFEIHFNRKSRRK